MAGIDPNKLRIIVHWLDELVVTVATPRNGWEGDKRRAVLQTYSDFLYADFNSGAFTRDSLRTVAEQNEFFPTYHTLHAQLAAWWREHHPPLKALAPPAPPPPPDVAETYTAIDVCRTLGTLRDHPMQRMMLAIYRAQLTRNWPEFLPMLDAFEAEIPQQPEPPAEPPAPASFPSRPLSDDTLAAIYREQRVGNPRGGQRS
jgi:hypothetical protein